MGTRSATGVRYQGADKLSYNQFDGYPDGVGQGVVDELRAHIVALGYDAALADLRAKASALHQVDESDTPTAEDFAKYREALDPSVSSGKDWYALLRGDHGSILKRLNRGVATESNGFIRDSLFCEYAYILNLDEATLEVYRGFQKAPHDLGRYGRIPLDPENEKRQKEIHGHCYHPCALWGAFPLGDLPEKLGEALSPETEEDEEEAA